MTVLKVVVIGGTGLIGSKVVASHSPCFDDGPAWDFFTTGTGNLLAVLRRRACPTMPRYPWWEPTGYSSADTFAPRRHRKSSSPSRLSRSRSCGQRSSTRLSGGSRLRRQTATRCGSPQPCANRWRPMAPLSPRAGRHPPRRHGSTSPLLRRGAALPDGVGAVMYYACIQGHTYAETAVMMNIPVGTVMSRVSRGRQRRRVALGHLDHGSASIEQRVA